MAPVPVILPSSLPVELLDYVLAQQTYPLTLIICSSRAAFLDSAITNLRVASSHPLAEQTELDPHTSLEEAVNPTLQDTSDEDLIPAAIQSHPLLTRTIHQLVTSSRITTVFCPTISHLRAYLAVFSTATVPVISDPGSPNQNKEFPLLIVYGILELHKETSEWNAQGLGNTLASLVQVGRLSGLRVVLTEKRHEDNEGEPEKKMDFAEERNRWGTFKELETEIPLLGGNARRAGLDIDSQSWSGRTVKLERILRRWFVFEKAGWE